MSARLRQASVIEASLVVGIFLAAAWWATSYWNASLAAGRPPLFYQEYFEPAVMMTCGKGFVVSTAQPKPLEDFLWRRTPRFSCADLPPDLHITAAGNHQWGMAYLMMLVSAAWRVLGISWSGLGPLCGVMFGGMIAAAYGIFRLGASRWISSAAALALATSTLQLRNAPHLRDFGKAPFALALVLLLAWLLKEKFTVRRTMAIAAVYGGVLGVAYGFRTDFIVYIPMFLIGLFLFVDGGIWKNLSAKIAAAAIVLASFSATAWPVLSAITTRGGCEWHVALLGFASQFDEDLRVEPAPYAVNYRYLDEFMYRSVSSYVARRQPVESMAYCSPEYDAAGKRYFFDIARTLPADILIRTYASARGMWNLPFRWTAAPLPSWRSPMYRARSVILTWLAPAEPIVILLALIAVSIRNPRMAACLFFFLVYLGGYPALQSDERHYFHLEFMTWWALALLAQIAFECAGAVHRLGIENAYAGLVPNPGAAIRRALIFAASAGLVLAVPLLTLRAWQQRELRQYFHEYLDAPKLPLVFADPLETGIRSAALHRTPGQPAWPLAQSALLEVEIDATACGGPVTVSFVYGPKVPASDFSRSISMNGPGGPGSTRVFFPAYEDFRGVKIDKPECLRGAFEVADVRPFPLLMAVVLAPGWETRPLYQRLK